MIWIVLGLSLIGIFCLWKYWTLQRGNLGKVIDYSKPGKSPRREAWLNYSTSEATLVRRVGEKTAERLIINVLLDNPNKSRKWCAEKALFDLERDQ